MKTKDIHTGEIARVVAGLCIQANHTLDAGYQKVLEDCLAIEESHSGREILRQLIQNIKISREDEVSLCQDTGMAVVFLEIGQDVHITGGSLTEAIAAGVEEGYKRGFLRNSVVEDPIERINTGNNTPPVIHVSIVEGDKLKITVMPKGFGSENMGCVRMLKPSEGVDGIIGFVLDAVNSAGSNPCPPVVVGVGIGGTMETAVILAKKALLRKTGSNHPKRHIERLERHLLEKINQLGIGPGGLGGRVTALAVNIEVFPTHIAGLPVAVNISCHCLRHAEAVI